MGKKLYQLEYDMKNMQAQVDILIKAVQTLSQKEEVTGRLKKEIKATVAEGVFRIGSLYFRLIQNTPLESVGYTSKELAPLLAELGFIETFSIGNAEVFKILKTLPTKKEIGRVIRDILQEKNRRSA